MSKDKDQKATVPKVTHIKIGDSKKKKSKSFIDFAAEYTQKSNQKNSFESLENTREGVSEEKIVENKNTKVGRVAEDIDTKDAFTIPQKNSKTIFKSVSNIEEEKFNSPSHELKDKEDTNFFPRFLRKQETTTKSFHKPTVTDQLTEVNFESSASGVRLLTTSDENSKGTIRSEKATNLNSFSSIFNKDSSSITGVKRVFKKSLAMMVLSFLSFAFLSFLSLHLFSIDLLWILVLQIIFITTTNIFYIVVADRSYVIIGLGLQALAFITAHSFIGQGFSIPTFFVLFVAITLIYFSYSDVEKTQLSSRLFSINHITSDSVRMLGTTVSLVLAIGMFNSALSAGSETFLREEVFNNNFVSEYIIIGDILPGINKLFLGEVDQFKSADEMILRASLPEEDPESNLNLYTFIYYNYFIRGGNSIFSDKEASDLRLDSSINFKTEVDRISRERAEDFRQEVYKRLPYNLDTVLSKDKYKQVLEETYVYIATKFESGSNASLSEITNIPLIPRNYILPGSLAIIVFALSFMVNFVLRYIVHFITSLLWFVLRKFDFARIDVENVEAEVVTI